MAQRVIKDGEDETARISKRMLIFTPCSHGDASAGTTRLPAAAELPMQQGTEKGSTFWSFRQPALGNCPFPTCEEWGIVLSPHMKSGELPFPRPKLWMSIAQQVWDWLAAISRAWALWAQGQCLLGWSSGAQAAHRPVSSQERKATCRIGSLSHCKDRSRDKELNDLFPARTGGKSCGWGKVALVKSLHRPTVQEGECKWGRIRMS